MCKAITTWSRPEEDCALIYFYVKRRGMWDEISFPDTPKGRQQAANFWFAALMQGWLIERVGSRKAA
jgi:hypothetical protein